MTESTISTTALGTYYADLTKGIDYQAPHSLAKVDELLKKYQEQSRNNGEKKALQEMRDCYVKANPQANTYQDIATGCYLKAHEIAVNYRPNITPKGKFSIYNLFGLGGGIKVPLEMVWGELINSASEIKAGFEQDPIQGTDNKRSSDLGIKTIFKEDASVHLIKELFAAFKLGPDFKASIGFFDGARRITTNYFKALALGVVSSMAREPLAFALRERPLPHLFQGPAPSGAVEWTRKFGDLILQLSGLLSVGPQGKGLLLYLVPDYKAKTAGEWIIPEDLASLVKGGVFYTTGLSLSYAFNEDIRVGAGIQYAGRHFDEGFKSKYDKKTKNDDAIDMLLVEAGAEISKAAFLVSRSAVRDGEKQQEGLYLAFKYNLFKRGKSGVDTQISYVALTKRETGKEDKESYVFGGALLGTVALDNGWQLNASLGGDRYSDPELPQAGLVVPRVALGATLGF